MQSQWNVSVPPKTIAPFCTSFSYEKLMLCGSREVNELGLDEILKEAYKSPIPSPKTHEYKNLEE